MDSSSRIAKYVALGSICGNIIIFGLKGWIAIGIGSLALLTDSVHTLSDSASSLAVYLGFKISEKPPDETHPFGHGRAEYVALLVVGIILLLTALKFLSDGIISIFRGTDIVEANLLYYMVIFSTAVGKEVMGEISYFVGKRTGSDSLKADAWHHRSDALTTMVVIAAIYGSRAGFPLLDPIVGIVISLILGYLSISIVRDATYRLLGSSPSEEFIDDIRSEAEGFEGVKDVHNIRVHDYGDRKAISLHMQSEPASVARSHRIVHQLTEMLEEKFSADVEVHLDPWTPPEDDIKERVDDLLRSRGDIRGFHDVKITREGRSMMVSFHLVLPWEKNIEKGHETATEVEDDIKKEIQEFVGTDVKVEVHLEPCDGDCERCEMGR